jgi:large-conductance mechanosensitive channel
MPERGPQFDRFLMRFKDFIIIGTAVFAIARWAYNAAQDNSQVLRSLDQRISNLERVVLNGRR